MSNILRKAGYATPELRKLAVAISFSESLGLADMHGDTSLEDDKWGPSIGLFQIRSLKAEFRTGKYRDASMLEDPLFNAASALAISNRGTDWTPWSVFKDGSYKKNIEKNDFIVEWPQSIADELIIDRLMDALDALIVLQGRFNTQQERLAAVESLLTQMPMTVTREIKDKLVLARTRRDVYNFDGAPG
jgi:hypothetical protein